MLTHTHPFPDAHSRPVPSVIWFLLCRCGSSSGSEGLCYLATVTICQQVAELGVEPEPSDFMWSLLTLTTEPVLSYSPVQTIT